MTDGKSGRVHGKVYRGMKSRGALFLESLEASCVNILLSPNVEESI